MNRKITKQTQQDKTEPKYINLIGRIEATFLLLKFNFSIFLPTILSVLTIVLTLIEKVIRNTAAGNIYLILMISSITLTFVSLVFNIILLLHKQKRIHIREYNQDEISEICHEIVPDQYHITSIGKSILLFNPEEDCWLKQNIERIKINYQRCKRYYAPYECRDNAYAILMDSFGQKRHFRDGKKIRMMSDLSTLIKEDCPCIYLTKTTYFNSTLTNEISFKEITSEKNVLYKFEGKNLLTNTRNQLSSLEESFCSNHIGVTTLFVTSDNKVIILKQGKGNNIDPYEYIPSASGSMDFSDFKNNKHKSFGKLVSVAMERELREECNLHKNIHITTKIVGFGRLLNRGGKPEFFGISKSNNLDSVQALKLIKEGKEIKKGYISSDVLLFDVDKSLVETIKNSISSNMSAQLKHYLDYLLHQNDILSL